MTVTGVSSIKECRNKLSCMETAQRKVWRSHPVAIGLFSTRPPVCDVFRGTGRWVAQSHLRKLPGLSMWRIGVCPQTTAESGLLFAQRPPSPRCHSARDRHECVKQMCYPAQNSLFLLRLSGSGGPRHWAGSPRPLSLSLLLFTPGAHQHLIFDNRQPCLLTHSEHPLFGHPMTADHHRAARESPGLSWNRSFSALWTHFQEFWLGRGQLCLEVGNLHRHQWASEEVALLWLLEFSSLFSGSWVFLAPSRQNFRVWNSKLPLSYIVNPSLRKWLPQGIA